MSIDTSYKGAKKLMKINGQAIYKALITITRHFCVVWSYFFVATDAHDQYITPLTNMLDTMKQVEHNLPRLAHIDNPSASGWLYNDIPSLLDFKEKLDGIANANRQNNPSVATTSEEKGKNSDVITGKESRIPSYLLNFDAWFKKYCTHVSMLIN